MTDKEFKRLKRADLIEIIYQMQQNEENYKSTINQMRKYLEDKNIAIENAGSIAEAALSLNKVFQSAQAAADLYLAQIQQMHIQAETELESARAEAQRILEEAYRAAQNI